LGIVFEAGNQRVQGDREDRTGYNTVLLLLVRENEDTEPEEVLAHVLWSGVKAGRVTARMSRTLMCKSGGGKAVQTRVADQKAQTSSDDGKLQGRTAQRSNKIT